MSAKADKTGSCSFCGQTKIIQVPEEWEQGQINEAVTCECECEQAQAYAKAKERKDKAKKRVNELFGGGAEKPVAEDVVNLLIATVDAIEDKHIRKRCVIVVIRGNRPMIGTPRAKAETLK